MSTLRGAYESFNAGNPQGVLDILADDAAWTEPGGGNAASGTFTGPGEVGEKVLPLVPQYFDEFKAEAEDFKDEGDSVVVSGRFKGKSKSGVDLDAGFEHTWKMSDGKVASLNNGVQDMDNWTEAWS
ncbi:MAG: nuclear transport factor 2 family protein [Solirubrobacterales bacterium]